MFLGKPDPKDEESIEKEFPSGTEVCVLGANCVGVVVGNLRILYPEDENGKYDYDNGNWFIDVQIEDEIKPLDPWLLSRRVIL